MAKKDPTSQVPAGTCTSCGTQMTNSTQSIANPNICKECEEKLDD